MTWQSKEGSYLLSLNGDYEIYKKCGNFDSYKSHHQRSDEQRVQLLFSLEERFEAPGAFLSTLRKGEPADVLNATL